MDDVRLGFSIGKIVTMVVIDTLSLMNAYFLPRTIREFVRRQIIAKGLQSGLLVASILVPQPWLCVVLWYATLVVDIFGQIWCSSLKMKNGIRIGVPIDVAHMAERFGYVDVRSSVLFLSWRIEPTRRRDDVCLFYVLSLPLVAVCLS